MFLHKKKNGYYCIYYKNNVTGRRSKISCKTKIKAEAVKFLSNLGDTLNNRAANQETKRAAIDLTGLETEVIKYITANMSTSNVKLYKTLFKNLLSFFGNIPINQITFNDIERYKSARALTVSKASVNKDVSNIKASFNYAVKSGWLNSNPAAHIKKVIIADKELLCFSNEQIETLIKGIKHKVLKQITLLGLYTGCRLNEIINLQWRDINLQDRLLTITNKADFKTKTGKIRQIPISDNLFSLIKSMLCRDAASKVTEIINPDKYIFGKQSGYRFTKSYITRRFKNELRALQFEEKYHFHCLRHTFITNLIKAGVSINFVKELAGHSNIQTTMRYIHITANDLREAVNKINIS